MFLVPPPALAPLQRVLIVALIAPTLLLITVAALPALAVMPFFPGGTERSIALLRAHMAYVRTLLTGSQSNSPTGCPAQSREGPDAAGRS
ncbi:hypothetical protein [Streptomyces ochraceiscleroticus]|uniref:dTMP kinase n=1 Tax=Streptomyces ochraceiscleroticus TaxID=47761 RepID=A0ABW1MKX2_9ACTN|nr:hypothetical protein [Streptomyces ochraceiscleroticus]